MKWCPNCQLARGEEYHKFCFYCGTKLEDAEQRVLAAAMRDFFSSPQWLDRYATHRDAEIFKAAWALAKARYDVER